MICPPVREENPRAESLARTGRQPWYKHFISPTSIWTLHIMWYINTVNIGKDQESIQSSTTPDQSNFAPVFGHTHPGIWIMSLVYAELH